MTATPTFGYVRLSLCDSQGRETIVAMAKLWSLDDVANTIDKASKTLMAEALRVAIVPRQEDS